MTLEKNFGKLSVIMSVMSSGKDTAEAGCMKPSVSIHKDSIFTSHLFYT